MAIEIKPAFTRSGDAQVASWKPTHLSGTHRVFAHEEGGVTLEIIWPHRPSDRISYMQEEWDAIVAFVEQSRQQET